jgi:hypothetical protein
VLRTQPRGPPADQIADGVCECREYLVKYYLDGCSSFAEPVEISLHIWWPNRMACLLFSAGPGGVTARDRSQMRSRGDQDQIGCRRDWSSRLSLPIRAHVCSVCGPTRKWRTREAHAQPVRDQRGSCCPSGRIPSVSTLTIWQGRYSSYLYIAYSCA